MQYLNELVSLENEWQDIKISGEEYTKATKENPEMRENKRKQISIYREKLLNSNLSGEEKERKLKEMRESLEYLEERNPVAVAQVSDDRQLLTGILLGGLITIFGMYLMDEFKTYLKENLSESIMKGLYSEIQKQRI